jgi:hypothetical protein
MPSGIGMPPYKWTTPMQVKELDDAAPSEQPPMRCHHAPRYAV